MATVPACDVCGAVSPRGVLPPTVEPVRWQAAVADYVGTLCWDCMELPLPQILRHFEAGPGGVVDGKARGPYMVHPTDDEAPATE